MSTPPASSTRPHPLIQSSSQRQPHVTSSPYSISLSAARHAFHRPSPLRVWGRAPRRGARMRRGRWSGLCASLDTVNHSAHARTTGAWQRGRAGGAGGCDAATGGGQRWCRLLSSLSSSSSSPPSSSSSVSFSSLPLSSVVLSALSDVGWLRCTEVQARALPLLLPQPVAAELLIAARTGTGKSLAALIPAFERAIAAERQAAAGRTRSDEEGTIRGASTVAAHHPQHSTAAATKPEHADALPAGLSSPSPRSPALLHLPPTPFQPFVAPFSSSSVCPSPLSSSPSLLRPLSVVLVPSRELVSQWLAEAKLLARGLPVRVERLSAERTARKEKRDLGLRGGGRRRPAAAAASLAAPSSASLDPALPRPISLLICTPHRLQVFLQRRLLSLSAVRTFVVDEADVLLDSTAGFSEEVERLLQALHAQAGRGGGAKDAPLLLFLAASVPPALLSSLRRLCPSLLDCSSPTLHSLPPSLPLRFVPVTAATKLAVLVREVEAALSATPTGSSRVLVFCNSIPSCRAVEAALASQLSSPSLVASSHGSLPSALRLRHFASFVRGDVRVLVCTDLASRGLDLPFLSTTIQFDLAHNATDFLHRAGRLQRHSRHTQHTQLQQQPHTSPHTLPRQAQEAVSLILPGERRLASAIQEQLRSAAAPSPPHAQPLPLEPLPRGGRASASRASSAASPAAPFSASTAASSGVKKRRAAVSAERHRVGGGRRAEQLPATGRRTARQGSPRTVKSDHAQASGQEKQRRRGRMAP